MNRFSRTAAFVIVTMVLAACGSSASPTPAGATDPTPLIIYVTPAPTAVPTAAPTEAPDITPEPTVEIIEDITPEPEPVGAVGTTRENPLPVGKAAKIGDWTVKVTAVNRNAWKVVKAANQFNDAPPAGTRMVMVSAYAKYSGDDRVALDATTHQFVIGEGTETEKYSFEDPTCGVLPGNDLLMDDPTVRKGGIVKGNNCWVVENSDVNTLVLYWSSEMFDMSEDGVWFALK